jgi:GNAT superfamily N-acetyltransferase
VLTLPNRAAGGPRSSSLSAIPDASPRIAPGSRRRATAQHGAMSAPTYRIRHAVTKDIPAILDLIGSAAAWLQKHKNTDQWIRPWPTEQARNARITRGVHRGSTWMVEENGDLAATITCRDRGNPKLWTPGELSEPAVYVSRLIVGRSQAGKGLGAALIDWAGLRGIRKWSAESIRVDVWTTNLALHEYYKGQGFEHLRTLEFEDPWEYPSAALFHKPIADIDESLAQWFYE